jgi:hypothetical protein
MRHTAFYYKSQAKFEQYYFRLKQTPCRRCGHRGFLILHGALPKSYTGNENTQKSRGHRIYCSNRNRRKGCGKTFSALECHALKGFVLNTVGLWKYLLNLLAGDATKKESFEKAKLPFHLSMAYRLWKRFALVQSRLRTQLSKRIPPPTQCGFKHSFLATIVHLKNCFPDNSNPIAAFQVTFQTSFL